MHCRILGIISKHAAQMKLRREPLFLQHSRSRLFGVRTFPLGGIGQRPGVVFRWRAAVGHGDGLALSYGVPEAVGRACGTGRRCGRWVDRGDRFPIGSRPRQHLVLASQAKMRLPSATERHAGHHVGVAFEDKDVLALLGGPDRDRGVDTADAGAMRLPSGLNATLNTSSACPFRARTSWPFSASHTLAVLSPLPVTMRWPSGLNATLHTHGGVSAEGQHFLPVLGVPHPHRLVDRCR